MFVPRSFHHWDLDVCFSTIDLIALDISLSENQTAQVYQTKQQIISSPLYDGLRTVSALSSQGLHYKVIKRQAPCLVYHKTKQCPVSIMISRHFHLHLNCTEFCGCCGVHFEDFIWSVNYLKTKQLLQIVTCTSNNN